MYAVIETGGKQHRVVEGELIKVEKIEAETGSTIDFDRVLMVGEGESIKVGTCRDPAPAPACSPPAGRSLARKRPCTPPVPGPAASHAPEPHKRRRASDAL